LRLLVTGGCGFIGINLIAYLRRRKTDHLVVLDNLSEGRRENLREFEVEFVEGDVRDAALVNRTMRDIDAVVHLAADTRVIDSIENPDFNFQVNVVGTYNLLAAARSHGIKKFVMASTGGAIVGEVTPPVREDMAPKPVSPYGASKLCGEAYCSAFAGAYGMKTVCLRFSNVYGPRSFHKGSVVAHFFKQVLQGKCLTVYGDGEQTRDFVFVDDISAGIASALTMERGGSVYQLGTGAETSVNELIRMIRRCVGEGGPVSATYEPARKGELLRNYCDISLARRELGYAPQVDLLEGLARTWEWFRASGPASRR
jgi:UDP-glucose 4-epimerase